MHTQSTRPAEAANRPRPTPARPTLMEVLRTHGLRELAQTDTATLRRYRELMIDKITTNEALLRSNIARGFAAEIGHDNRLFRLIDDEISTILTAAFNTK